MERVCSRMKFGVAVCPTTAGVGQVRRPLRWYPPTLPETMRADPEKKDGGLRASLPWRRPGLIRPTLYVVTFTMAAYDLVRVSGRFVEAAA